eukprot:gene12198-31253_t
MLNYVILTFASSSPSSSPPSIDTRGFVEITGKAAEDGTVQGGSSRRRFRASKWNGSSSGGSDWYWVGWLGTSGTGAFLPGVYNFSYPPSQLSTMKTLGFTSIRIPINIKTANNPASLIQMRALVEGVGGGAVICMFGTGSLITHGTGRIDSMTDAIGAWRKVHLVFASLPDVYYEIFNEPHGSYIDDMQQVIAGADLPQDRCILDALGWAQDVKGLVALGWEGYIGYHFYPWWLPANSSRAEFAALLQLDLLGASSRIFLT